MGVFVKRNHGTEYIYMLAGKSQYFLGRKNDLENLNFQNMHKAIRSIDKNFEMVFSRYIRDLQEHSKYLPADKREQYISKRIAKLDLMLRQINKNKR